MNVFESSTTKPRHATVDNRLIVPAVLVIFLSLTRPLFLFWRYVWFGYALITAAAIFMPIKDCRARLLVRTTLLCGLLTPNVLIGHGIFIFPAWMSLFYQTFPGIVPLTLSIAGAHALTLYVHRTAHPDHPRSTQCKQPPKGSAAIFASVIVLALLFLPIEGVIDRADRFLVFRTRASHARIAPGVSYEEASWCVETLSNRPRDLYVNQPRNLHMLAVYRLGPNLIVETRERPGPHLRWTFVGGARGTLLLPETIP